MKIAIDISQIVYETGVSNYTKKLVENLLKVDKENKYVLFGGSLRRRSEIQEFTKNLKPSPESFILPIAPSMADLLWNKLHTLSIEKFLGKIDVFHSSDWSQPPSKAFKVTTIHDLVPILYSNQSNPKIVSVHKRRLDWIKKEVDRIIVPSEVTKNDLIRIGFNKNIIRVIYEAPDEKYKPAKNLEIKRVKEKHNIDKKYLLSVGVSPRKNTNNIISAYEKKNISSDYKLIIIGHKYSEIYEAKGVIYLGHVKANDMPGLYSGAEALIYPSLYEGFGLPILEAMACGCPVVTSNVSSMPEVAGDAAVLVDPKSTESILGGLDEVLNNKSKYIKKGIRRAGQFSWENTAKETLKIYKEGK